MLISGVFSRSRVGRGLNLILAAGLLMLLAGCPSLMTATQAQQVNKFATAAEGYGPVPGDVIRQYADQRWSLAQVNLSTMRPKNSAAMLKLANESKAKTYARAKQADQALSVLMDYAALLKTLTASDYSDALAKEAESFGESIDKGIGKFNELSGGSVETFGSLAGAAVRGVGGLYIRHKQGEALKRAVTKAKKGVNELMSYTRLLLQPYAGESNDFSDLRGKLGSSFMPLAAKWYKAGQPIPMETLAWYDEQYKLAYQGEKLAKQAVSAAEKFIAAHDKLVEALENKDEIAGIVGRVGAFASEVEAALTLKKQMES
ncbi:hypothetical protein GM415_07705 [Pseudodesulfovibrio cashew]|uniref:DUF3829 domain-containing protein n=1 Tax=Pseudodesulfovibrio cashew TaxID=2678688 RepID=A0A6I6JQX0_9BACT|nr:hypothetical protein [Pseudodesulfovibrio cashew]QGY40014.1 hypothetical protein GM415_07705 [Pseudodesulfovibrio cashew]